VAYATQVAGKQFVVVDGEEGKKYYNIIITEAGRIIFDSPDTLHHLARKGNRIYSVEERIK